MKKLLLTLLAITSLGVCFSPAYAFKAWKPVLQMNAPSSWVSFSFLPENPEAYLLASKNEVLLKNTQSHGQKSLWQIRNIHRLVQNEQRIDEVFILTDKEVIQGNLKTQNKQSVFHAEAREDALIRDFKVMPLDENHWLVASDEKIHESDDGGSSWSKMYAFNPSEKVLKLMIHEKKLWVLCESSLYSSNDLIHFEKIFSVISAAEETEENEVDEVEMEVKQTSLFTDMAFLKDTIYISSKNAIYVIDSQSRSSKTLTQQGFREHRAYQLLSDEAGGWLAARGEKSVYLFDFKKEIWQELFQGLIHSSIRDLNYDPENKKLMALTPEGVLHYEIPNEVLSPLSIHIETKKSMVIFLQAMKQEPSALQVQKAILDYTGLKKEKIQNWHRESRLKSIMPRFSFGKDYSRGNSVDLDRGSTSEPDVYIFGPDDIDEGWDMSLSWDLGDLIWSSSQTSIDSRDKLMIDQRHDLLSEAMRIYYERRRLQLDLFTMEELETLEAFQLKMRIDELTSLLDAMTGGLFSKQLTP